MGMKLITAPAVEPISLEEAKAHLRVDHSDDDTLIGIYIQAARQTIDGRDGWLGRALVTQTWELQLDAFTGDAVQLPLAPLQSVTSVKYDDADGVEQTLDAAGYDLDTTSVPGWLVVGEDGWPTTLSAINAVRIRYIAGYGDAADVPAPIRAAILLMVGDLYAHRETAVVGANPSAVQMTTTVENLLAPYRVWRV
jgi:uncharacterized phiE125 gp8 family phage protein